MDFLSPMKRNLLLHTYIYSVPPNYILRGVEIVGPIMVEVLNEDVGFNFRIWVSQIYYAIYTRRKTILFLTFRFNLCFALMIKWACRICSL